MGRCVSEAQLDDQRPFDPRRSRSQINGLLNWLGKPPRRVLDLGSGAGRTLVPLACAGHKVTGVDCDPRMLARCDTELRRKRAVAKLIESDFTEAIPVRGKFDAVLCLGNTFMQVVDVEIAVALLRRATSLLKNEGAFFIDDFPFELWREVAEGNWTSGLSPDGGMQMVWDSGDSVFALRKGPEIDSRSWTLKPSDRLYRLWSMGALRLAAIATGLSGVEHMPESGLIVLRRPGRSASGPMRKLR
jgi:SAM-dependent methyltransferase